MDNQTLSMAEMTMLNMVRQFDATMKGFNEAMAKQQDYIATLEAKIAALEGTPNENAKA